MEGIGVKQIKNECCGNCLYSAGGAFFGGYCKRYPKPMQCIEDHWCGEYAAGWMPVGERKRKNGMWIQMWAHRRENNVFAYTDEKGNTYDEKEYSDLMRDSR